MKDYQFIIISINKNRLNKTMNLLTKLNIHNKNIIQLDGFSLDNCNDFLNNYKHEDYIYNNKSTSETYNKKVMCCVKSHMKALEIASLKSSSEFSIILEAF